MYDISRLKLKYSKAEMMKLREMWDEIFNDSKGFTDYYFEKIAGDEHSNKILVSYYDDVPVGMVHLNPYIVRMNDREETGCYIVGVAVRENMRGHGIMRCMMERVLCDLENAGCALAFLMPERQEYYTGLGFEIVYRNRKLNYRLDVSGISELKSIINSEAELSRLTCKKLSEYDENSLDELSAELNRSLGECYSVFAIRSREYLRSMSEEHMCQNGDVCVLYYPSNEGNRLSGIYSYDLYNDVMYVERFYGNAEDTRYILAHALARASDNGCLRCVITVPEDAFSEDNYLFEGLLPEETAGKGVMARLLKAEDSFLIEAMKNRCFFDEIV